MKRVFFAAAVLFFIAGTASAEDAAGIIAKLKANDLKMQSEFKDVKIVMDSKMTQEGMDMQSSMQIITKGKKSRTEVSMMGMKTISINDGKDIWMISAQQGKKKLNSESEAGHSQNPVGWADIISEKDAKVTDEAVDGRKCYGIESTDKQGKKGKWYIDKTSMVLVKFEGNENGKAIVVVNSDFKKVKGSFEMPYRMEMTSDGKPMMSSIVKSVELNKGVDDSLFNIDSVKQEDLGKMDMEQLMKMMPKK